MENHPLTKLIVSSPSTPKHLTLIVPGEKIDALIERLERMAGVKVSQSVLLRRGLDLLEGHLDRLEARLDGGYHDERRALVGACPSWRHTSINSKLSLEWGGTPSGLPFKTLPHSRDGRRLSLRPQACSQ